MKVLVTGTSQGIGRAIAKCFLNNGHLVYGIDRKRTSIESGSYTHFVCDIRDYKNLPEIEDVEILINNAGTQNEDDIDINLKALIHITEKYGVQGNIRSVVNDPHLWNQIMDQTPLKRWATPEEIARWAYFLTVENSFCTGQSIIVDGGESINSHFIWP